jgi:AbrB family looped-hinge helix DNA binding protein
LKTLETTVTQKGQVTIPVEVRRAMGLGPRSRVRFELHGDVVVLRPVSSKLLAGYGAVTPETRPEDYARLREEFEQGVADEVVRGSQYER